MEVSFRAIMPFILAMAFIVVVSNILVQYPFEHFALGELLTWGAFTYPFAFLVNDLANRQFGQSAARRVIAVGFALAVLLSIAFASPRIAIASGSAFLFAQLLDAGIFNRLRNGAWWRAPLISTLLGSVIDTVIFFGLAFAPAFGFLDTALGFEEQSLGFAAGIFGIAMPLYASLAIGDFLVKVAIGLVALVPYGALINVLKPGPAVRPAK